MTQYPYDSNIFSDQGITSVPIYFRNYIPEIKAAYSKNQMAVIAIKFHIDDNYRTNPQYRECGDELVYLVYIEKI